MPPSLSSTLPAAPPVTPTTRHASWLLPTGLLFSLLLLGHWSQTHATLGSRSAAVRTSSTTHPPRPALTSTVVSTL